MGMIDKEDAIKAVCEACYMYKYIGEHYKECKYYPCDDVTALEAVPEAPKPAGDLISRADAIDALGEEPEIIFDTDAEWEMHDRWVDAMTSMKSLPSAEAVQGEESGSKLDLISRASAMGIVEAAISDENISARASLYMARAELSALPSAVCDDCIWTVCNYNKVDWDTPSAEAVQGEWVRKEKEYNDCDGHSFVYWYECDKCGARPPKDQWGNEWHSEYCPSCGAKMNKGGDDE